ncbi:tol-like protein [Colletotrichum truncatum]|uniref:Tol-like protein n=1 Tax=Colletotrichum truncatum TaxID=5467 RepID=A0ACC3YDD3_COLTU
MHFAIAREWLEECDSSPSHINCRPADNPRLPARLLDVQGDVPYLRDSEDIDDVYLALSHPWGDPRTNNHFCTYTHNIESHKKGINFNKLPATFRDAITVTRQLGFRYLWIDSLCIIQGPNGDFAEQSKSMGDVFSSAHCVIAASRATGQEDGFLGERAERSYISINRKGEHGSDTYHVCEQIDDFQGHVIDGSLNKRGWVLQERALARRTLYFTESQTYWECGGGIRCETFTKLENNIAAFLGDPRFPEVAMRSSRGERIYLYQIFYKQYSRLQFTRIEDRPFGIAGLEKRLIQGFGTNGGYGVFDDNSGLLHRSLLWYRGQEEPLERIRFSPERNESIPSWSWMAYKGGIDYLDLTGNGFDWEQKEIQSPWVGKSNEVFYTTDKGSRVKLVVTLRRFDVDKAAVFIDVPSERYTRASDLRCVILARSKNVIPRKERICYVLIVAPRQSEMEGFDRRKVFLRVGVGYTLERYIHEPYLESVNLY